MSYQKYGIKPKTVFYDPSTKKPLLNKTESTITFRSLLEYEVFQRLVTAIGVQVYCQVPIQGKSFVWNVDFMIRASDKLGERFIKELRTLLNIPGSGSVYVEAKGQITKEFAEKVRLCAIECPNIYKNLIAFGSSPLGVVIEDGFNVFTFPIRSTELLCKAVLCCNNKVLESLKV